MNYGKIFCGILVALFALPFETSVAQAQRFLKTRFFSEPAVSPPTDVEIGADHSFFEGKLFIRDSIGNYTLIKRPVPVSQQGQAALPSRSLTTGGDFYIQDGAETSIGVDYDDGNNLVAAFNQLWPFPALPPNTGPGHALANSTDGNLSWNPRNVPNGSGVFTGFTFDPWVVRGNAAGEFLVEQMRFPPSDPFVIESSHVLISRSTDGGASFSLFFEKMKNVFQDKPAIDIDRTTVRGGGTGSTHDAKVYLGYDDDGPATSPGYKGSFLQVVSAAGAAEIEIQISGTGTPPFRGRFLQPMAGTTDGAVYVKGHGFLSGYFGGSVRAYFHEITNGGAGPNTFIKSSITYNSVGQRIGTSPFSGLNGHRSDIWGYLDIDHSSSPQHGYLYFISNRNPNPANAAVDQGDIYLSISTNGATSWSSAVIPTAAGKTQHMPMMDVDEQGWIHIAYYQNETGSVNGGVLNASTANIYYTVSTDGGTNWTLPVQVNDPANALDFEDPPPDRAAGAYYLIGDYAQLATTGNGANTKAYILWTGYDKDRSDTLVGDARAWVFCTTVQSFPQCQNDIEPPVITCPTDIATPTDSGQCTAVVSFQTPATDNCPLGVTLTCDPPSGSAFSIGIDTVACIATDLTGNADTCSFTVAVSASVVKGDMNADGGLSPADVVLMLNCVFLDSGNCGLCFSDGNCSGEMSPADVVLELNAVFLGSLFPC